MKLHDYLREYNLRPSQLAARMGKPASTVTRLLNGQRQPSIALTRDIAEATGGHVMPNDFMPAPPATPATPAKEQAA